MGSMIVKVDAETMQLIGATSPQDFTAKLADFVQTQTKNSIMADNTVQVSDLLKRVEALEARQDLTSRIEVLEKRETIFNADEVKKLAEAAATQITTNALASVGTTPMKPAAVAALEPTASELEKAGNYEAAYKADKVLQVEFDSAASYEAFAKADAQGLIKISKR